ncbi:hypothetical protein [Streptomyces flavidovirens]
MTQHIIHPCPPPAHGALSPATGAGLRFGAPQAATLTAFPLVGGALHVTGTPVADVLLLLGGCGAIGTGVIITAAGGLRRMASATAALLQAAAGK